jgi:hypothetical protein
MSISFSFPPYVTYRSSFFQSQQLDKFLLQHRSHGFQQLVTKDIGFLRLYRWTPGIREKVSSR